MSFSIETLKQLFIYSPLTGDFVRRMTRSSNAKIGMKATSLTNQGYIKIKINGKMYSAHRLAWFYMTGTMPNGEIDHINMIKDDNRWCNLRLATRGENRNNLRAYSNNKSGLKGVQQTGHGWTARITVEGKLLYLGKFKTSTEASECYRLASIKYFGEFARSA